MYILHYLAKSMNVLNALLILAVVLAADTLVLPFLDLNIQAVLPGVKSTGPEAIAPPVSLPQPPYTDYAVVSEQNLFHPARKIPLPPEKKEEKTAPAKPDLVLYGTLITPDLSIAYIEDRKAPYSTPGRGNRQRPLKKGESVNGYVLQDVEPHRIVLAKGEEKLVVLLDVKDKKRGELTATAAGSLPSHSTAPAGPMTPMSPPLTPTMSGPAPGAGKVSSPATPAVSKAATSQPVTTTPPTTGPAATVPPVTAPPVTAPVKKPLPPRNIYTRPGARPYDIRPRP